MTGNYAHINTIPYRIERLQDAFAATAQAPTWGAQEKYKAMQAIVTSMISVSHDTHGVSIEDRQKMLWELYSYFADPRRAPNHAIRAFAAPEARILQKLICKELADKSRDVIERVSRLEV